MQEAFEVGGPTCPRTRIVYTLIISKLSKEGGSSPNWTTLFLGKTYDKF